MSRLVQTPEHVARASSGQLIVHVPLATPRVSEEPTVRARRLEKRHTRNEGR